MGGGTSSLLALLQIADSSFPIGTFAHSYGLEQLVRDRFVRDAATLEAFVRSSLVLQMGSSDARAVVASSEAAAEHKLARVIEIDLGLSATRPARELRDASTAAGKRLLQEVFAHPEGQAGLVSPLLAAVYDGRAPGTYPVALGVVGSALGVERTGLTSALLFSTANTLVQAAMRLLPVSHRDAQAVLHRTRDEIAALAERASEDVADGGFVSFHPLQEIAAMRHERAGVRFFAS